jgi:hypothetical protein
LTASPDLRLAAVSGFFPTPIEFPKMEPVFGYKNSTRQSTALHKSLSSSKRKRQTTKMREVLSISVRAPPSCSPHRHCPSQHPAMRGAAPRLGRAKSSGNHTFREPVDLGRCARSVCSTPASLPGRRSPPVGATTHARGRGLAQAPPPPRRHGAPSLPSRGWRFDLNRPPTEQRREVGGRGRRAGASPHAFPTP